MRAPNDEPKLYSDGQFRSRLAGEIQRAIDGGRPYAVLACVPRQLPGEQKDGIIDAAAECILRKVRGEDIIGKLNDDVIIVGVKQADPTEASVLANRLQSELEQRGYQLGHTVWDTGIARLVEHGTSVPRLVETAIEIARRRRQDLAASGKPYVPPPAVDLRGN